MKFSGTIELRTLPSGRTEVLLEKSTGSYRDSKLHRELFTLPDDPATDVLKQHIQRMEINQ